MRPATSNVQRGGWEPSHGTCHWKRLKRIYQNPLRPLIQGLCEGSNETYVPVQKGPNWFQIVHGATSG